MIKTEEMKNRLPFAQQVASYLRNELSLRGMTQAQFAEMTGYSDRQIRRWIKGDIRRVENIDEIAKALNVDIREIVSYGNDFPVSFL